jgi:hypothetical protein
MKAACCLCVKNCEPYLPFIFSNLDVLSKLFNTFYVVFVYDHCHDDSVSLLTQYKSVASFQVVVKQISNESPFRTVRIAKARNAGLKQIYKWNVDFHFMIDADDVNCFKWNVDLIQKYLVEDTWDALSFNRPDYYDIWALMYEDYKHHCWGFTGGCNPIVQYLKKDITTKLAEVDDLFPCYSAFNGFAIYRTERFKGIQYEGCYSSILDLITDEEREKTLHLYRDKLRLPALIINENVVEHCEHLYYHLSSKARIRISKHYLAAEAKFK